MVLKIVRNVYKIRAVQFDLIRQILKQENSVSNGEFILENNTCFAFFDSQSAEKLFHHLSLYSKVNFIETGS